MHISPKSTHNLGWLFGRNIGLFCGNIGHVCGNIGSDGSVLRCVS